MLAELPSSYKNCNPINCILPLQLQGKAGCWLHCTVELCGFCAFWALRGEMAPEERIKAHLLLPLLPSGGGTSNQALLESSQSHSAVTVYAVFADCTCSRMGGTSRNRKLRWIFFFLWSCTCIFSFLPFLSDSQRSFLSRDALPPYPECPVHVGAVGCFPTESRCPPLSCFSRH